MWGEASGKGGVSPAGQVWCQRREAHVYAAADGVPTPETEEKLRILNVVLKERFSYIV